MLLDNVAIKDRFLGAVFAGDKPELKSLLHPEFEMHQNDALPYGGIYQGPEGFLTFLDRFMGLLDIDRLEGTETFQSEGGAIVMQIAIRARLKDGGALLDTSMLEKWEFREGKVVRISPHYFDTAFR